ncbi:MAG TPA: tRNA lysidine(34) synthetase TilS [Bacteroidia bacterium]|jgi:tRNA(Ile)-lysidine synthase|nr:tRNA lysidine(34) synthetase TilS [Bacteroidia bacterium]
MQISDLLIQEQFKKYISTLVRKPEQKTFLLAVSGGVDSVVMADLFCKAGYSFAIAHCNFQLRGKESDGDEAFVNKLADGYGVAFHVKHFDTTDHAENHKVSIQMAARDLRYEWLKETERKHNFNYIVIAHHSDDALETFFINLLRGTGIAGLHGIASVHESILRPLLCFNRKEIESYASVRKLKWREDSSNASDKYERNKIRHHLIPELLKISPDAPKAIKHTIENLSETELIYKRAIEEKVSKLVSVKNDKVHISSAGLNKLEHPHLYLYEYLKAFGFNFTQAKEICESLKGQSGKVFLSLTHRLTKDRRSLVLEKLSTLSKYNVTPLFKEDKAFNNGELRMSLTSKEKPAGYRPFHPPTTGCFDFDKLIFPLTIRAWAKGDKFYPLGMKNPKKISDFLIDNKVSLSDKDGVYVMLSGKDIVWVIGHRIDDRFKIASTTKKLYICNILNTD